MFVSRQAGQIQVNQVSVSLRYIAVYSKKFWLGPCSDSAQLLALDSEFGNSGGVVGQAGGEGTGGGELMYRN